MKDYDGAELDLLGQHECVQPEGLEEAPEWLAREDAEPRPSGSYDG